MGWNCRTFLSRRSSTVPNTPIQRPISQKPPFLSSCSCRVGPLTRVFSWASKKRIPLYIYTLNSSSSIPSLIFFSPFVLSFAAILAPKRNWRKVSSKSLSFVIFFSILFREEGEDVVELKFGVAIILYFLGWVSKAFRLLWISLVSLWWILFCFLFIFFKKQTTKDPNIFLACIWILAIPFCLVCSF